MNIQRKTQQGFTLIELMIVIAIVGILAAIALPAYQDYTVRSKMSEPMAALAEAKTTVAEYYASNSGLPTNATSFGINTAVRNSDIFQSLDITGSAEPVHLYAVVYGSVWGDDGNEYSFQLSGSTNADGTMTWECLPDTGGLATGSSGPVPLKYLPANCRG